MRERALTVIAAALLSAIAGCGESNARFMTPARKNTGLVVILPGIEGESPANQDVRRGLDAAGAPRGLAIWHWGRPIPGIGMILNQIDFVGNRLAGERIAKRIMEYQDEYPGRPVHIVGHSGGGGVAVFAAEALPEGRKIDGLVLLSASIHRSYDVTKAMKRLRCGIVNFYNEGDVALLGIGTTVMGNVDGTRGGSAGLVGFDRPGPSADGEKRLAYSRVYNRPLRGAMLDGAFDPHFSTTRHEFVMRYVSPWVLAGRWPVGS